MLRADDAGPIPVVYLGAGPIWWLPMSVFVPTTERDIAATAAQAISGLLAYLDWPERDGQWLLDQLDTGQVDEKLFGIARRALRLGRFFEPPSKSWITEPATNKLELHPRVSEASSLLEATATQLAPELIQDRYRFRITATARSVLANPEAPFHYALVPASPNRSNHQLEPFTTEGAAQGHRIWIQLALLQAVEILRRQASMLHWILDHSLRSVEELYDHLKVAKDEDSELGESAEAVLTGDPDIDAAGGPTPYIERLIRECVEEFGERRDRFVESIWEPALEGRIRPPRSGPDPALNAEWLRAPLFVIDEPEQHLHPRAQRELAVWLADLVRANDSQALITTHSVPFINRSDRISYIRREGPGASSISASDEEITALNEIAADVGLNRGELLSGVSLFLFVEGPSDRLVLEGLFGERLQRMGVAVIPMHGVLQLRQIMDATVLVRYSTAKTAFLVDNMDEYGIRQMLDNPGQLEEASRSNKTEERETARLLLAAKDAGRRLEPLGLPATDIFFLLDAQAIRDSWRELRATEETETGDAGNGERFVEYPGHDQFWAECHRSARKQEHWKTFCRRRYGMPVDVDWYLPAAERLRASESIPRPLIELIDRVEDLAIEGWSP